MPTQIPLRSLPISSLSSQYTNWTLMFFCFARECSVNFFFKASSVVALISAPSTVQKKDPSAEISMLYSIPRIFSVVNFMTLLSWPSSGSASRCEPEEEGRILRLSALEQLLRCRQESAEVLRCSEARADGHLLLHFSESVRERPHGARCEVLVAGFAPFFGNVRHEAQGHQTLGECVEN